MRPLVIFGGSFDPIHNGHLRIAKVAADKYDADVVFVLAKTPRWKNITESEQNRLDMLKAALEEINDPRFSCSTIELEREGDFSYSIDTVKAFSEMYPGRKLYTLIGADQVNQFDRWRECEGIAERSTIIFSNRPGIEINLENVKKFKMEDLNFYSSGEVSSTRVRVLNFMDIPLSVYSYIIHNHLYFMKELEMYITPKRLKHSESVALVAYKIALSNFGQEMAEKALITGLIHDLGKKMPEFQAREIMKKEYPDYQDYPEYSLHQWTGAYLAKNVMGVEDESILLAIKYHCTGRAGMTALEKIIYSADKIEPTRGYDSSDMIRACIEDYEKGFRYVLDENMKFLSNKPLGEQNGLTEDCKDYYLGD
ncbi:MAG: nicotinate (nicotinamide) nucleotide adenylyltransferase [Bacilli bacterium]|nr:nicotinate (nicotinamide) nucleotide adenylyltransferase [Bacilli bacterium]